MANSSDPYPPEERYNKVTRGCLRILKENDIRLLILTKSNLVTRDIDILKNMKVAVSITITTIDDEKAKIMEPNAPAPSKRLEALRILKKNDIPCIVRIDPIIPGFNDSELEDIVDEISLYTDHVVASTLKPRADSIKRLKEVIDLKKFEFSRLEGAFYLPENLRFSLLERVEKACKRYNISFATCRERYRFKAKSCDGGHLIPS